MTHLLDTNVFIAAMRGQEAVLQRLRATNPADIGISSVSLYELYSGVERCARPLIEKQKVEKLIQPIHLLPFDADAAQFTAKAIASATRKARWRARTYPWTKRCAIWWI